jgi:magnesium chelatase subunit H
VFGNAEGAYGSNVNLLIDNSRWEDEKTSWPRPIRAARALPTAAAAARCSRRKLLKSVLSHVELAYQNLDSVELGVTTIDTYFDTLGGISRAVKRAKAAWPGRPGGAGVHRRPDQRRIGGGTVRTLDEQVALETRTRMLNPKWYEGMLEHGYEGVRQIEVHLTNTMGWSATTGQVQPWVYQQLTETFVLDPAMRERLAELNPTASPRWPTACWKRHRRQYWQPDDKTLEALQSGGRGTGRPPRRRLRKGCRMNDVVSVPLSELKRAGPRVPPPRPTARAACRCSWTRT